MLARPALHRILLALLALAGASVPARAQAEGGLDGSFWTDGKVVLPSPVESVEATVAAPDGRVVVTGIRSDPGGEESLFWRVVGDSQLDAACGPNAPAGGTSLRPFAAAFDSQGRLVIAGWGIFGSASYQGFAVRYLYPACDLDETFNTDGIYRTNLDYVTLEGIAFDSSSRVVLAGSAHDGDGGYELLVVRLTENGNPDSGFGFAGVLELDLAGSVGGKKVAVQPDGRIVVGGYFISPESSYDFFFARLDEQGELDDSFTGDGTAQIDIQDGAADVLNDLVLDPVSGKILGAGYSSTGTASVFTVVRLLPNGLQDETLDDDGVWTAAFRNRDHATSIELQSDGKILVAGNSQDSASDTELDFLIYRLLPNGDPDGSFDGNGRVGVSFDLAGHPLDHVNSTSLQAGKLVLAGYASDQDGPGSLWRGVVARLWIGLIFADGFERATADGWSSGVATP